MIDKEKILAKIEFLLNEINYEPFTDEVFGRIQTLKELKSYIDSLQEEPVDKCKGCNNVKGCITCVDGDQYAHYKEPVGEELEEASKEWLAPQLDKSYAAYGETKQMELTHFDGYAMLDAIEFGAKWKEQQITAKDIDGKLYSTFCGSEQNVVDYVGYSEYCKRLK